MNFLKRNIYYFFRGLKALYLIIPIITLICVSIVVYKAVNNKKKVEKYEEHIAIIENKDDSTVDLGYDNNLIVNKYKDIEVNEYVNCLNKQMNNNEMSSTIKNNINTLENLFNQSNNHFAFKYTDIYTGFTISYNENQGIFTASTIKAPMAIYLYEQSEQGLIDLEEKLTYTSSYYSEGTGILKTRKFNQEYTIRELISYAIIHSDNAAHNMLMDKFGRENMYNFWNKKGTKLIFKENSNWGIINANDATIYMKELYDYYSADTKSSNELMKNFTNVTFKPLSNKEGKKNTANKSGWSGSVFHDVAIVFEKNPYILVVLSNLGEGDNSYSSLFSKTSNLVGQIHEEYWKLKYSMCQEIINR